MVLNLGGVVLSLIVLAGVAYAGFKQSSPVFISISSRFARGALADARSGAASSEIGCFGDASSTGAFFVECTARDASGVTVMCTSANADMARAAQSISDSSFILFEWDTTGACTFLRVANDSSYSPRAP